MQSVVIDTPTVKGFGSKIYNHPLWTMIAAFGCYFCVYGFRKPFTAGAYESISYFNISWKSLLISSQIFGYLISKALGIFIVSSIGKYKRIRAILLSISFALLSLLGYALCPAPYSLFFLFLNGLPLGMIFGYIQGFLEGKNNSEMFVASLGSSFILADGFSKSTGSWLLNLNVPIQWMPFIAGAIFLPFTLLFVWMLTKIPTPTAAEINSRSKREPMSQVDRKRFLRSFLPGILGISFIYLMASLLRGIRSDYALEIWNYLGVKNNPALFSQTESWVMAGILAINGCMIFIKNNKKAFNISQLTILIGFLFMVSCFLLFKIHFSSFWLIVLSGFGIYLPYLTITSSIFERLIALTKAKANVGFLMYVVDFIGYLGYNILVICTNILFKKDELITNFFKLNLYLGGIGIMLSFFCYVYFYQKLNKHRIPINK